MPLQAGIHEKELLFSTGMDVPCQLSVLIPAVDGPARFDFSCSGYSERHIDLRVVKLARAVFLQLLRIIVTTVFQGCCCIPAYESAT